MAILAASVETNGWVLRLDVAATPGSFASYVFDPDGTPRLVLASDHAGFAPSGGQAIAATLARTMIGAKPLRVAAEVVGTTLQPFRIDETDLGGGIIRVRIALSEHVYVSDTNLRLAVAAGWRTGAPAATNIVVTNNSTAIAPIPIMRWALPQLSVVGGVFRLSMVVMSHHPNGFQPVAGVRFTVTDGTTLKTIWTTALATDNSLGDNLRCYTVTVDPATATALTAGLLRCDAEVYPWLGAMRSTDPAGTRAMANLRSQQASVDAATPFVVGYDPAGTRYSNFFAFVDFTNGTTTPAASMVAATLAGAKAVAPASRPKDINTALQACRLVARTLPAANGQLAQANAADGFQIVLAAQSHMNGAGQANGFGITTAEMPIRVIGDPDDANPRENCILQTATSRNINNCTRWAFQNLTIAINGAPLASSGRDHIVADNLVIRAIVGSESSNWWPFNNPPPVGTWSHAMTRTRWWRLSAPLSEGNGRLGLMRNCEHSMHVKYVLVALKNRFMPRTEDSSRPTTLSDQPMYAAWPSPTLAGQAEDIIIAHNDMRSYEARVLAFSILPAATAGTPNPSIRRHAFVGNLCERIASVKPATRVPALSLVSFGGDGVGVLMTASYNIFEGNTFVGDRANMIYNEPPTATLSDVDTLNSQIFVNRIASNSFARAGTKHDEFNNPGALATRVVNGQPAHGYRPQLTQGWSDLYGVGHESNVFLYTSWSFSAFDREYWGRGSYWTGTPLSGADVYTDDRSYDGSNTGQGNYRPKPGSPVSGRVARGQCDVDFVGTVRPALADAGSFQTMTAALGPAAGWSGMTAPSVSITWSADLLPMASALLHRTQMPTIAWRADLAAAAAASEQRAMSTDLALAFGMVPAAATVALVATDTALLRPAGLSVRATVVVAADPRALIPNRN